MYSLNFIHLLHVLNISKDICILIDFCVFNKQFKDKLIGICWIKN